MKKLTTIFLLMLICAGSLYAQTTAGNFSIHGIVADSISRQGEPYATVSIFKKEAPDNAIKKVLTNKNGNFNIQLKEAGKYIINIASMGRITITRDVELTRQSTTDNLGTLLISDNSKELKGVEVVAQKPLIKSDIDKITYNMEDDPEAKSNQVIDMLRKVPLVTVDGQDNIKVNNSSSFKVYVNGKPNNMMSKNPTEVLKSMPASSIKRIEVITNPGPKYDAEGVTGILNIITIGQTMKGYTATLSGNVSNTYQSTSLFTTVQQGKLTLSGNFYLSHYKSRPTRSGNTNFSTGDITDASTNLETYQNQHNMNNGQSASLEASYEIDTLRLITASVSLWPGQGHNDNTIGTSAFSPFDNSNLYHYSYINKFSSHWVYAEMGMNYQRSFKTKDRLLTLSYQMSTNPSNDNEKNWYYDINATDKWKETVDLLQDMWHKSHQNTLEHTAQIDYTTPFAKYHTLETGAKMILRNAKSLDDRFDMPTGNSDEAVYDQDNSSHYQYKYYLLAGYLGYGLKYKKLSTRVGLRYEYSHYDMEYLLGKGADFTKHFSNIVPSASIGYQVNDQTNWRLGYNMRIYRPGIWALNPYIDDADRNYIIQGNTHLDSERSHNFDITYSNYGSKIGFSAKLSAMFTNNSVEQTVKKVNDRTIEGLKNPTGKEVFYQTRANIGKIQRWNMFTYFSWNITKTTKFSSNLAGAYTDYSDRNLLRNHGWSAYFNGYLEQSFTKDWRFAASYYVSTGNINLQGKSSSNSNYGVTVSKAFLDKRLNLSVYAYNFLRARKTYSMTVNDSNFNLNYWSDMYQMRFGISASLRIGKLNTSVKRVQRSIENDDTKSGGKSK